MSETQTPHQANRAPSRALKRRSFYPANEKPTSPELAVHRRGRRDWFPHHKTLWKKTEAYRQAKSFTKKPKAMKKALAIGGVFAALGLASFFAMPDAITHAMRAGFHTSDGGGLAPLNLLGLAALFIQGGLGIVWYLRTMDQKKWIAAMMVRERYEEWLRRDKVVQEDLQKVLVHRYDGPNPYDPTDEDISVVLGEHFDNDAHKFGPVAHWYTMKMKGMQTGGVIIFGVSGAGKTSTALRPIMRQVLGWMAAVNHDPDNRGREKVAAWIVDPKAALRPEVRAVLASAGTDPVLDPAQLGKTGDASVTPVYYLLHERANYVSVDGQMVLNPAIIEGYRGRSDDYLEMGYDQMRVDRAWEALDRFQGAAGAITHGESSGSALDGGRSEASLAHGLVAYKKLTADPPTKPGTEPSSFITLQGFLRGVQGVKLSRRELATIEVDLVRIPWGEEAVGDSGQRGEGDPRVMRLQKDSLYGVLGGVSESLVGWLWIGRSATALALRSRGDDSIPGLPPLHPQIPGLAFSRVFPQEAYAVSRNQVRRLAPLKIRPTSKTNEYRDTWAKRELQLWAFSEGQAAVAARAEACARMLALVQPAMATGKNDSAAERDEAFGHHLAEDLLLLRTPLDDLVGPGAVSWEHGRPAPRPTERVLALIERVKMGLPAGIASEFRAGNYFRLSVPLSERPTPEPEAEATRARMKGRYASPDPLVQLVHSAAEMRIEEADLLAEAMVHAAKDLHLADQDVAVLTEEWGIRIQDQLTTRSKTSLKTTLGSLLSGLLSALVESHGGVKGLLGDALASVLGGPCAPGAQDAAPMNDFLMVGDDLGGEAMGLMFASLNPSTPDLTRWVRPGVDATFQAWTGPGLGPCMKDALAAGSLFLESSLPGESARQAREAALASLAKALRECLSVWASTHLAALEGALEGPSLAPKLQAFGARQAELFVEAAKLARRGGLRAVVDEPLARTAEERLRVSGPKSAPNADWSGLLWSPRLSAGLARRGSFWRGVMSGRDMTPLHASQWDEVWSFLAWRALSYTLSAGREINRGFAKLADLAARLGGYQQAALEAFTLSVAPNIAWRTDGPFAYNPLFAPDLEPIVVTGTFTQTIFNATKSENSSSDEFWENAGFTVVFNLFMLCNLVDGYATFPRIYDLAADEAVLREYLAVANKMLLARQGSPEELETIAKIQRWASSEWLTEASAKSETKDNVIRSLSVVSEGFKVPKMGFCFAPATKEDISFPSWTWVMKHGKVVVANLPWEQYEKVAKVVLPLANKTFMKAVQMRDAAREENKLIERTARGEITALEDQMAEIADQITRDSAERMVLDVFFQLVGKPRGSQARVKGLGGHAAIHSADHPLARWRRITPTGQGVLGAEPCLGDDLLHRHGGPGTGSAEILGLLAAMDGQLAPFDHHYFGLSQAMRAWVEAGVFARLLREVGGHASLGELAAGGHVGARKLLQFFGEVLKDITPDDLRSLGLSRMPDPAAMAAAGVLALPLGQVLSREVLVRLTGRREQLSFDHRGMKPGPSRGLVAEESGFERPQGSRGMVDAGVSGHKFRPRTRIVDLHKEARRKEAKIAEMPNTERPVLYLMDEAHFFLQGKEDAQYVTVARSNNALNFYSTQSPSNLYATMGEEVTRQFLDSLPNRVVLKMPDAKAAESCAEFLGGKKRVKTVETSISQNFDDMRVNQQAGGGQGKASGGSLTKNMKEEERWVVDIHQIVGLQAMEAFAFVWDGKKNTPPTRVFMKPDYLFTVPEIRSYRRAAGTRYQDLPPEYPDGMDLYALTVPRLLELGIIDASR